jgi:hypothetical protein
MARIPNGRPHPGTVENFDLSKLLFIEVATASAEKSYQDLENNNPTIARIFADSRFSLAERFPDFKSGIEDNRIDSKFLYEKCAGIYPEFGKIVCVSLGALDKEGNIKITTFKGDEKDILLKVRGVLETAAIKYTLCGHNIKSFDIPYLGKRYMINGLKPPSMLPTYETKPWEIKAIDTRDIWTFGGFKSFSSLSLISNLLGLTQHTEVKGEDVSKLYWDNHLDDVVEYCESEIKLTIAIINKINSNE